MTNQFRLFKGNGVLAGYADTIQEAMSACDRQHGWYFEKEGRLTKEERNYKIMRLCVNKQLERHKLCYDDVKKSGHCEFFKVETFIEQPYLFGLIKWKKKAVITQPWYWHLTFESEQEFNDWKEFCIDLFRKELKMSKAKAETEFDWFNLSYGIKQNYEVKI